MPSKSGHRRFPKLSDQIATASIHGASRAGYRINRWSSLSRSHACCPRFAGGTTAAAGSCRWRAALDVAFVNITFVDDSAVHAATIADPAASAVNRRLRSAAESGAIQIPQQRTRLPAERTAWLSAANPLIAAAGIASIWRRADPFADIGFTTTTAAHQSFFEIANAIAGTNHRKRCSHAITITASHWNAATWPAAHRTTASNRRQSNGPTC